MNTCPYCGDGEEAIGTLHHLECAIALHARVAELEKKIAECPFCSGRKAGPPVLCARPDAEGGT